MAEDTIEETLTDEAVEAHELDRERVTDITEAHAAALEERAGRPSQQAPATAVLEGGEDAATTRHARAVTKTINRIAEIQSIAAENRTVAEASELDMLTFVTFAQEPGRNVSALAYFRPMRRRGIAPIQCGEIIEINGTQLTLQLDDGTITTEPHVDWVQWKGAINEKQAARERLQALPGEETSQQTPVDNTTDTSAADQIIQLSGDAGGAGDAPAESACGMEGHAVITVAGPPQRDMWTRYREIDGDGEIVAIEIPSCGTTTLSPRKLPWFDMPAEWMDANDVVAPGYITLAADGSMGWMSSDTFDAMFDEFTPKAIESAATEAPTPSAPIETAPAAPSVPSEAVQALQRAGYQVADDAQLAAFDLATAQDCIAKEADARLLEQATNGAGATLIDSIDRALELLKQCQEASYSSLLVAAGKDMESARGWVVRHLAAEQKPVGDVVAKTVEA